MEIKFNLKNGQSICGALQRIEYQRKENGLFEVTIHTFYGHDDKGNQIEYCLKLDNAKINTDEESGCINVEPFTKIAIGYDEDSKFSITENDCIK